MFAGMEVATSARKLTVTQFTARRPLNFQFRRKMQYPVYPTCAPFGPRIGDTAIKSIVGSSLAHEHIRVARFFAGIALLLYRPASHGRIAMHEPYQSKKPRKCN